MQLERVRASKVLATLSHKMGGYYKDTTKGKETSQQSKSTCTQSSHSPLPSRPLSTLHDKGHSALTIERQSLLGARKNSLLFLLRRLIFQDIFLTYTCAGIHDRIILGKHILRNKMIKATGAF